MAPGSALYVGAGMAALGGADPRHRAVLVRGDRIAWTGTDPRAAPAHDRVIDLGAAWLTPGFVDAHVHATATGLLAAGLDLSTAASAEAVVQAVREHHVTAAHGLVYGAGWDDLTWDRRPTAAELAAAAPGCTVVLIRVDGHSCLVDADTLSRLDLAGVASHVHRGEDGQPSGWLLESASAVAQQAMRAELTAAQLSAARLATCARALSLGITAIHEMGIPDLSDRDDAIAWATGDWPIDVQAYWAEPVVDPSGLLRPGGDLFLDGSIGSCTAAMRHPYTDPAGHPVTGELFWDDDTLIEFVVAATHARVGAGVHAIGDRAVEQALRAVAAAADICGVAAVRDARHRIEHVEVISRAQVDVMAHLGVTASVQPAFDATWNGPEGLYEQRFGRHAADDTNPFDWFDTAGVALCLSSDSAVTPMDPWGGVQAAQTHHGGHGIARGTALHAATIGGHRAVGAEEDVGALIPGRRADLVAWPGDPLHADPTGWAPVAVVAQGRLCTPSPDAGQFMSS